MYTTIFGLYVSNGIKELPAKKVHPPMQIKNHSTNSSLKDLLGDIESFTDLLSYTQPAEVRVRAETQVFPIPGLALYTPSHAAAHSRYSTNIRSSNRIGEVWGFSLIMILMACGPAKLSPENIKNVVFVS